MKKHINPMTSLFERLRSKNALLSLGLSLGLLSASQSYGQGCNLVTNGTFAGANNSCLPATQFSANACGTGASDYRLTNNVNAIWGLPNANDPTPGGGTNYMIIAALNGTQVGWAQSVSVVAGAQYNFSIRARNLHAVTSSGNAQVSLNISTVSALSVGTAVSAIVSLPGHGNDPNFWNTVNATWTAPSTGNVWIQVVYNNAVFAGHDFAIDDIAFTSGPVVAAITGGNTVCVNDILALDNATPGGTWSSSNNAIATVTQRAVVTGVAAGNVNINYTVVANGCTTVVSRAVTVNGLPPAFTITGASPVCPGLYTSYAVSPITANTRYYWVVDNNISNYNVNGISTNIMVYSPASGNYNIKAVALNNCGTFETTKAISVSTDVPPAPDLTCSAAIAGNDCPTVSVTNNGSYTVQWTVGGVVSTGGTSRTRSPGQNVTVKYISPTSGCTKSRDRYATTICAAYRLAEEVELSDENAFKVYPSPTNGLFNIETNGQDGTASIVDVYGRTVKTITLSAVKSMYEVNLEEKGTYIIKIRTAQGAKGYKLVVE